MRGDGVRRCGVEDCVVGIKDRGGGKSRKERKRETGEYRFGGDEKSGEYRSSTVGGKGQSSGGCLPAHPLKMLTPYECCLIVFNTCEYAEELVFS